jgi:hypothetical protein
LLFQGDVIKLSRIKHFSAGLALHELGVFLAGNYFYDGMFADGGHGVGVRMVWILPVSNGLVNCVFHCFVVINDGDGMVKWLDRHGCKQCLNGRTLSRTGIVGIPPIFIGV